MQAPKVLIIDDDPALHQAMKMALKNEGFELFFAGDGQSGLAVFREEDPELVFLDLKMPVMDGYQFLKSIEITPDASYTVIAITGHGDDREIDKCYRLGVDFFLKKPPSLVEICCLARRCIEMKRLRSERVKLVTELRTALEQVKTLTGLLPVCASCKNIRNDAGEWEHLETYLRNHSEAEVNHSLCPLCAAKLSASRPGSDWLKNKKGNPT